MQAHWSNGDLVLSWTNPTGELNWQEVDQMRVVLFDVDYNDKVFVSLDKSAETVSLPAGLLTKAAAIEPAAFLHGRSKPVPTTNTI